MQVTWKRIEGRETSLLMTSDMAVLAEVSVISHDPEPDMKSTNYKVRVHGVDRGAVASMNEGMAFAEVTLQDIYRAQLEGIERIRDLRSPEPSIRSRTRGIMDTGPWETASEQIEHLQTGVFASFLMGSLENQSSPEMITKDLFSKLSRNFRVSKINTDLVTDIISDCSYHMLTADLSKAILCGLQAYESAKLLPTKDQASAIKDLCVDPRLFKVVNAKILDEKSFYSQSLDEGKRIASHRILNLLKQDVLEAQRVVNHLDSEVRRTPTDLKPSSRKKPSQDISR